MNILNATKKMIADFAREEEGAQIVEYGMIIGAVSLALIVLLVGLSGTDFSTMIGNVGDCLKGSGTCATKAGAGTTP